MGNCNEMPMDFLWILMILVSFGRIIWNSIKIIESVLCVLFYHPKNGNFAVIAAYPMRIELREIPLNCILSTAILGNKSQEK